MCVFDQAVTMLCVDTNCMNYIESLKDDSQ